MSMLKEFRDFAVKGNVIDLAVGIIIGAAFGKIVDSLVNDVVMPAINAMVGGAVDFSNQYVVLSGSVPAGTPLARLAATRRLGAAEREGAPLPNCVAINSPRT